MKLPFVFLNIQRDELVSIFLLDRWLKFSRYLIMNSHVMAKNLFNKSQWPWPQKTWQVLWLGPRQHLCQSLRTSCPQRWENVRSYWLWQLKSDQAALQSKRMFVQHVPEISSPQEWERQRGHHPKKGLLCQLSSSRLHKSMCRRCKKPETQDKHISI